MTRLSPSWTRLLTTAAQVLLVGMVVAPNKVFGECGVYFLPGSKHSMMPNSGEPNDASGMAKAPLTPPCRGPECSNSPAEPLLPPTPPSPPPNTEWAFLIDQITQASSSNGWFRWVDPSEYAIRQPNSIFRPPKTTP